MWKTMFIVGLGGFFGSCGRYLTGRLAHHLFAPSFPYGTLIVNLAGCFLIGLFFGLAEKSHLVTPAMNAFLITGFCGGFTTFSTFADDLYLMIPGRHWAYLAAYAGLSIVLGIALVWLGRGVVKAF